MGEDHIHKLGQSPNHCEILELHRILGIIEDLIFLQDLYAIVGLRNLVVEAEGRVLMV